jgi:hypothetical protein
VIRQRGVVYDTGRSMGSLSMNWRPDYTPALMRRELEIIRADLHANAVRLGGRDPRRVLAAADYAASLGLNVWLGPELWNATPQRTLSYITAAAAAAEPLYRRWPDRLTFCIGNELTLFMRGLVPGHGLAQRSRLPRLREVVLSGQDTLRAFLAEAAASVRRVYGGPVSYSALPFERVDWDHFDVVGVNYYRQQARSTELTRRGPQRSVLPLQIVDSSPACLHLLSGRPPGRASRALADEPSLPARRPMAGQHMPQGRVAPPPGSRGRHRIDHRACATPDPVHLASWSRRRSRLLRYYLPNDQGNPFEPTALVPLFPSSKPS